MWPARSDEHSTSVRLVTLPKPMKPVALLASTVVLALAGCQGGGPPIDVRPVPPLSRVYVQNATAKGHHVRMNWPDGFIQVAWIGAGMTQGLMGAIGTSGFPATIDVLTEDCEPVASLAGLPPGSTGIVVIAPLATTLHRLDSAHRSWGTAGSLEACGATPWD